MVDIGFRSQSHVFNSASGTSTVLPVPAGVANGDRMVCLIGSVASSPTITDPAGATWHKIAEYAPGTTLKTAAYYRDVTGVAEPGSYTWGWSGVGKNWAYCAAYTGVDLTSAPTVAQMRVAAATGGQLSPALALADRDWLLTYAAGRENPGTDAAKTWSTSDTSDTELLSLYYTVTGTDPKPSAALWHSGRALAAGTYQRTITASVTLQLHLWSVRLAAQSAPSGGGSTTWSRMGLPRV